RDIVANLAPFKVGEPYSQEEVDVFVRRLNATNYFASVQISVDTDPQKAMAAPVEVSVIEAPSRRLDIGVGYSTNTLYSATINWRDVDLFDSAWRLRSELRYETKLQRLTAGLDMPSRADGWTDTWEATAERTDIENLVTRGVSIGPMHRRNYERRQPAFGAT